MTIFPFLIHCQAAVSPRCMEPVWCFPCYICLCGAREGWGAGSQKAESLKWEPVFMFVSGFPSLSFPLYPQQQAASSSSPRPSPVLLFSSSISASKSVPAKPVPRSLSLYTPASLCLCSSLDLGAVCLDAEEEENLSGGTQLGGAPRLGRKSACGTGSRTFRWN